MTSNAWPSRSSAIASRSIRVIRAVTATAARPIPCSRRSSGTSKFRFRLCLKIMCSFWPRKKSFRFVFISSLLTAAAIGVALVSAIAGQVGEYELAALGSKVALGLALVIVIYVVPRLAQNINFNSEFSVHIPNAGLLFFALILLVTILSLSSGNNLLYLVLAALLATMFVSWVTSRLNLNRIKVSVRFPNHIFAGESAPFDLTVTNRNRLLPVFSLTVAISEQDPAAPKVKDHPANPTELI